MFHKEVADPLFHVKLIHWAAAALATDSDIVRRTSICGVAVTKYCLILFAVGDLRDKITFGRAHYESIDTAEGFTTV